MRIELDKQEIKSEGGHGLEIAVKGFQGDAGGLMPVQVFIEYYNGKLAVHVWDGSSEDCVTHIIPAIRKVASA